MYLTKIWLYVLSFALAGALALALLVPRPALRELEKEQALRLGHVQHAAQLLLKVDARAKMDYAAHLAGDAVLAGALEETARGGSDRALHHTALERLRVFNQQLKLAFLMVLDARGRVLARVTESGEGDAGNYGDSMAGFPVVADALRGYRVEDAFALGGKLYRVAASPVFSRGRDRYVGALMIGMEAGGELAKRMHESLGAEVAFFLRGKLLAATSTTPALHAVPELLARHGEEAQKNGRTAPLALESGRDRYWAMATPIAGEAAQQEAYYVLLLPRTEGTGLGGFLRATTGEDLKGAFPWALVGVIAILALVVAMALLWYESEGPLARLRDEASRLAAGELAKLDDRSLRGRFAAIARSLNSVIERAGRAGGVPSPASAEAPASPTVVPAHRDREPSRPRAEIPIPAGYDLPMAAGEAAPRAEPKVAAPPLPPLPGQAAGVPQFPLAASAELDQTEVNPRTRERRAPDLLGLAATLPQLDAIPLEPAPSDRPAPPSRADRPARPPGGTPPLGLPEVPPAAARAQPPPPAVSARAGAAPPPAPPAAREPRRSTELGLGALDPIDASPALAATADAGDQAAGASEPDLAATLPGASRHEEYGDRTLVEPPSADLVSQTVREGGGQRDLESYYRKIYQDFIDLKRKCGEPTENVTYEKFVAKLKDNRDQLIRRFSCKSVRFQVYVKDGRAALKATPVRD